MIKKVISHRLFALSVLVGQLSVACGPPPGPQDAPKCHSEELSASATQATAGNPHAVHPRELGESRMVTVPTKPLMEAAIGHFLIGLAVGSRPRPHRQAGGTNRFARLWQGLRRGTQDMLMGVIGAAVGHTVLFLARLV